MRHPATKNWLWFALSLAACTISWTYSRTALMPWETYIHMQPRGRLKEMLGDLYPRWLGARELLLHGKNPYSAEVSHEIQMGFYGHPIEQTYENKPQFEIVDEQRFAYPIYVVFLLAPTVFMQFATVQVWAFVFLVVLTALGLWLWMGVLRWRPPPLLTAAIILFLLACPQTDQQLRTRQPALFVVFMLAAATRLLTSHRYVAAGLALSLATIKPQTVLLIVVWMAIWVVGDWTRRWPFAAAFVGSVAVLSAVGAILVPTWPIDFARGVVAYSKYFPTTSLVRLFLGDWIGGGVSVASGVTLLCLGWRRRGSAADSPEFIQTLSFFLLATTLLLPLMIPANQILLFLPMLWLIRDWRALHRFWRSCLALVLAWPWAVSSIFLLHGIQTETTDRWVLLPFLLTLLVPFLLLILLLTRRGQEGTPQTTS